MILDFYDIGESQQIDTDSTSENKEEGGIPSLMNRQKFNDVDPTHHSWYEQAAAEQYANNPGNTLIDYDLFGRLFIIFKAKFYYTSSYR